MPKTLSALLDDFAAKTGPEGARVGDLAGFLGLRGFGGAALKLGVLILLPIPFLGQIAGAFVLISGLILMLGASQLWLPGVGAIKISQRYAGFVAGASKALFGWAEDLPRPQLTAMLDDPAVKLCALAMTLAGLAAILGSSVAIAAFGLILLGFGLMEEDGLTRLMGAALCLGAGAFTLTMLVGAVTGAPYAAGWLAEHAPWLDQLLRRPAPEDGLA